MNTVTVLMDSLQLTKTSLAVRVMARDLYRMAKDEANSHLQHGTGYNGNTKFEADMYNRLGNKIRAVTDGQLTLTVKEMEATMVAVNDYSATLYQNDGAYHSFEELLRFLMVATGIRWRSIQRFSWDDELCAVMQAV